MSFAYDAAGRRTSSTAGGTTTNFLYDGGKILLEKQGSTTTATYTYGNALIRKDGETPLFDGQGSERTVTNSSQTVTGTLTLDGFGNQVASTGSSANPYMYAATSEYRNDGDAGLSHVGARYYDAQVGRFISRDTFLDQKPYLYCEHDPINAVDPSGHAGTHGHGLSQHLEMFPGARMLSPYVGRMFKNGLEGAVAGGIIGGLGTAPFGGEGAIPGAITGGTVGFFGTPIVDAMQWIEKKLHIKQ